MLSLYLALSLCLSISLSYLSQHSTYPYYIPLSSSSYTFPSTTHPKSTFFPFINNHVYCKLSTQQILTCHPSHVAGEAYGRDQEEREQQLLHSLSRGMLQESEAAAKVRPGRPKERAYHNLLWNMRTKKEKKGKWMRKRLRRRGRSARTSVVSQ